MTGWRSYYQTLWLTTEKGTIFKIIFFCEGLSKQKSENHALHKHATDWPCGKQSGRALTCPWTPSVTSTSNLTVPEFTRWIRMALCRFGDWFVVSCQGRFDSYNNWHTDHMHKADQLLCSRHYFSHININIFHFKICQWCLSSMRKYAQCLGIFLIEDHKLHRTISPVSCFNFSHNFFSPCFYLLISYLSYCEHDFIIDRNLMLGVQKFTVVEEQAGIPVSTLDETIPILECSNYPVLTLLTWHIEAARKW